MSEQEKYSIKKFPSSRRLTSDLGYIGLRKHHIKALIELDVTRARELIRKYRNTRKKGLSFTAWILKCIGQAISEYKQVQAIRKGKDRLVIFDDVDISIVVEKEIQGEKVPLPVVIRKVNEKSLQDIHLEIKAAKEQAVKGEQDYVLGENQNKWAMKFSTFSSRPVYGFIVYNQKHQDQPFNRLKS
jgi:pyruvate/2-oxoglutarate dehydrogenase complex dihydrolipoamide acyltransferase (E2) component